MGKPRLMGPMSITAASSMLSRTTEPLATEISTRPAIVPFTACGGSASASSQAERQQRRAGGETKAMHVSTDDRRWQGDRSLLMQSPPHVYRNGARTMPAAQLVPEQARFLRQVQRLDGCSVWTELLFLTSSPFRRRRYAAAASARALTASAWGATRFQERDDDSILAINAATLLTIVVQVVFTPCVRVTA